MKFIETKMKLPNEMNWKSFTRKWNLRLVLMAIILFSMISCQKTFYQFYKVSSIDDFSKTNKTLVFEDDNCKVLYDFWGEGGNVGFVFYNKTNENIYVNMKESFFINNGIAHDYFQNRTFMNSQSFSTSISYSNTAMYSYAGLNAIGLNASKSISGYNYQGFKQTNSISAGIVSALAVAFGGAVTETTTRGKTVSSGTSYTEMDIICVPSKTAKVISEYKITEALYRNCDLDRYPSKRQIRTLAFSNNQSPLVFSNKIAYTVGKSENLLTFENKFFVSKITNYPKNAIIIKKYDEFCGEKSDTKNEYFKNYSPDNFYVTYYKGNDKFKH